MAKVEIIAKLKQKNDADFKIADAKDIEMEDGSDLQSTIDNIKKNGTNIDTEKYATKEELETKANKEHTHDYNDITNAPEIPSIEGLATEDYVDTAIANAQLSGGEIDTSNFATKEDLNAKVDKKLGYSLVSDSEINRLSSIDNYDDTEIKNELNNKSDLGHTHSYKELSDKPTIPSIEGLATEDYVKNEIANAQLSSGEVDLSGYATKEELSVKADKIHTHTIADVDNLQTSLNNKANTSDLHSHSNKSILDGITSTNINNWNNKSEFSGSYNDLTDKPTIPSLDGYATETFVTNKIAEAQLSGGDIDLSGYATKDELNSKANKTDLHSHNNKTVIDTITQDKITAWDNKSNFSGDYNDLTNKPTIPTKTSQLTNDSNFTTRTYVDNAIAKVDLSGYATKEDLNDKANKVHTHTIVEINGLQTNLDNKADISDLHSHSNKTVLDSITSTDVENWNNKSEFTGDYNDLINKPTIPSLEGYATQNYVKNEIANAQLGTGQEVDLSGYATKDELNTKVDKIEGYSLVSDNEITRLSKVDNYNDTEIKNSLNSKANKTDLHSHANKNVLDGISSTDVENWNNKSEFSGDYNDLTNKPTLHSHSNKTILDNITASKVSSWDNKSDFSGSYNDLTDTPDIPTKTSDLINDSNFVNSSDLNKKADKTELHSHINKTILDNISSDDINNWNSKTSFDGDYNSLTNKPTIPTKTSDLTNDSNFANITQLNTKVDKKTDYSLVADTEIKRLANVDNYDDTEIKNELNNKSDIGHTHSYNNLTDKPSIPSIEGLATETFVTNKIAEAQLSQGEIDLTGYATKDDLKTKADKTELHSHNNKTILDGITSAKITSWDNKSNFSGNYNDLTNKPALHSHSNKNTLDTITDEKIAEWDSKSTFSGSYSDLTNKPTIPTKTSQLTNDSGYVTSTSLHSHANKAVLDGITANKITSWDNKSDFSGDYNDLTNKPTIPTVDVNKSYVDNALSKKVDKKTGYSLVSDSEIERLANVDNYDDTEIKNELSKKANSSDLHSHSNKTVLDGITANKVSEWNNKSTFSGNYNDLTNKPTIPTKTSQLTNDSNFATTNQLHNHSNKTVLDGITSDKIESWDNKSTFSGSYNDLTDKPTIPVVDSSLSTTSTNAIQNKVVTNALNNKANSSHNHTIANITNLQTSLNGKSDVGHTHSYNDLSDKPTIPTVDVNKSYVDAGLNKKVDKKIGYSLVADSEIERLAGVDNYDDTAIKSSINSKANSSDVYTKTQTNNLLNTKANKTDLHSHSNKTVLDAITEEKVTEWDNKSSFSGNYNDLTNKPTIPKVDSTLSSTSTNAIQNKAVKSALDGKANNSHTHSISNITNLQDSLDSKSDNTHTHSYNDLTNKPTIPTVDSSLSATSTNAIQNKVVTNALNNKANSSHTHSYNDLSDKPTIPKVDSALSSTSTNAIQNKVVKSALDGKANSSHTHSISNITNLQNSLNSKSDKGHRHDYSELENPPTIPTVDSALSTTSINAIQNKVVTNALNGKANTSHTHNYAGSPSSGGSASSAIKLATSRKISLNGDASGSANFDGTSDITINTSVRKYCMVGSDVENSNGWYKVASETMSGYGDTNITFIVTSTYGNYHSGILQLQIRSDNTNISCKTLVWFNRYGFSTDNFIVNINNMTWTLYTNQTIPRYGRLMFEVISESSITTKTTGITLFNSSTKESTTPVATVKSKDGGKVDNALTANKLATSRTLTIGKTGKTFDGSANVSWSLDEIGASASSHTHTISNVTNLQTALDGKSNTGHTHDYSELNNPPTIPVVDSALSSTSTNAIQNKVVTNALNGKANSSHTHSYKDLSDKPTIPTMPTIDSALSSTSTNPVQNKVVKTALDGKANSSHTHSISNITNLQTTLDNKSDTSHTHSYKELSDKPTIPVVDSTLNSTSTNPVQNKVVTNALNGKANSSHTHSYKELSDKPTIPVVDSALSSTSTNAIQNKVVKSALDGKANSSHTHSISNITNLQTTLDGKSNTNHTHKYAGSSSAGGDATNALACSGNSATATKLQTARTINGTSFDGSSNITTSKWGTARNITIGNTTKTIDGSGNISWTLREIGIYDSVVKIVTNTQELKSALLQGGAIYILGGTYPLAQNEVLEYVSNTHLIAIGDVTISINPTSSTYIAMRPHLNGTEGGYTGVTNFNMSGITFDGNGATNACGLFATAHGRNIHIEGCTFKNINNSWHLVEINSSDTVVFDRCTISDYNYREIKEGDYFTEAFQLDYAGEGGLYPFTCLLDNTGCQNITFNNCTFTRVKTTWTACIGSHSYLKNSMPKNVTINGCSFDDIDNCIYGLDYKNLSVLNCTFYNVAIAIIIDSKEDNNGTSITAIGNRYNGKRRYKNISQFNGTEEGRFIMHHNYHNRLSSSNISNNFIEWAYSHGIGITPVDTTIIGNSVRYCGKHGIYLYGGQQTSIIGNTSVYNGQLEGYTGYDIYVMEGAIKRVWRCNISNNASYVTVSTTSNFNDVIVANNLNTKG